MISIFFVLPSLHILWLLMKEKKDLHWKLIMKRWLGHMC